MSIGHILTGIGALVMVYGTLLRVFGRRRRDHYPYGHPCSREEIERTDVDARPWWKRRWYR